MKKLTTHQIRFAELIAAGENQTAAYLAAYPKARPKPETAYVEGCRMAKRPDIAAYVAQLKAKAIEKASTKISHGLVEAMREAEEIYNMAKVEKNFTAMAQATTIKNRLLGLFAEDRKNDRTPLSDLSDTQLDQHIASAASEAGVVVAKAKATAKELAP